MVVIIKTRRLGDNVIGHQLNYDIVTLKYYTAVMMNEENLLALICKVLQDISNDKAKHRSLCVF